MSDEFDLNKFLKPEEMLHHLNQVSQVSTVMSGEKESDEITFTFEDERMLIMMGDYDYTLETGNPNKAVAMAALLLQWATRTERLSRKCACNALGQRCMDHKVKDSLIQEIIHKFLPPF